MLIFGSVSAIVACARWRLRDVTNVLNVTVGMLVLISLVNILNYNLSSDLVVRNSDLERTDEYTDLETTSAFPDIYYIIPDAYTSSRNLKDLGFDNSNFEEFLSDRGFVIPHNSRSNYMYTEMSVASSLNGMVDNNKVVEILRAKGYKIIDIRWGSGDEDVSLRCFYSDDFMGAILTTLIVYPIFRHFDVLERQLWQQGLCQFSTIFDASKVEGPKFVFAHLSVPHHPYIFGRNGPRDPKSLSTINPEGKSLPGVLGPVANEYIEQLMFVNQKLEEVVEGLLSREGESPIIVIQADHGIAIGPRGTDDAKYFGERFKIFNAYRLPDGGNELVYDSISPVNSFRLIFNQYFGEDFQLLEDRSFYTEPPSEAFTPVDVTHLIPD